jgi:hypothetical protein
VNDRDRVSMDEIEAEDAVSLPNKEVMSLLDVNANVDLGLDLAAPVDLAVAANLNVAAPIEASAAANVLSPDAQAVSLAQQSGSIDQGISGTAEATAPQHATIDQTSNTGAAGTGVATTAGGEIGTAPAAATSDITQPVDPAATSTAGETAPATADAATDTATAGATGAAEGAATTGAVAGTTDAGTGATTGAVDAVTDTTGGVESLLSGGSLLEANVDIHAAANLTAPIDGAVAANANVAAPIDAAVAANVGSQGAIAEALAPQEVNITQHLDGVTADATAEQDADVTQK